MVERKGTHGAGEWVNEKESVDEMLRQLKRIIVGEHRLGKLITAAVAAVAALLLMKCCDGCEV